MFKKPFSFNGRIRRLEYGISVIIFFIANLIIFITRITLDNRGIVDDSILVEYISSIPCLWFIIAQGAKRCHDLNLNGWWQFFPFQFLWMIFKDGFGGQNDYGENPKH